MIKALLFAKLPIGQDPIFVTTPVSSKPNESVRSLGPSNWVCSRIFQV